MFGTYYLNIQNKYLLLKLLKEKETLVWWDKPFLL